MQIAVLSILTSTKSFILNFFADWSIKICSLRDCIPQHLQSRFAGIVSGKNMVPIVSILCMRESFTMQDMRNISYFSYIHSFFTKKCLLSEVLMKILCLILLCIFLLDYFLCRFLSKKVSKLIYTKFKYMFYTVNTCSHFSEFNITVASYFLSGLEKYDSMLS